MKDIKRSWSWLAFFFTPLWLGYNRMYFLFAINLASYLLEMLISYIFIFNNIAFSMIGVFPAISSIIFGLYGKSFKRNLENKLIAKAKVLKKGWVYSLLTFLILFVVLTLASNINYFITGEFSIPYSYLYLLIFQGIFGVARLVMTILLIWFIISDSFLSEYTLLYYDSPHGNERFSRNIPSVIEKKINFLNKEDGDVILLQSPEAFMEAFFCKEDKDSKYYVIEYGFYNAKSFQKSKNCQNKKNTISILNKFYSNDNSYRADAEWEVQFKNKKE